MTLRSLPAALNLKAKRLLVRVDWNVPLGKNLVTEEALKIERSMKTLTGLSERGAIVIVMTHLGRPSGPSPEWSTRQLLPVLEKQHQLKAVFHPEQVGRSADNKRLAGVFAVAEPGSIHLLENVRFEPGEEKNSPALSQAYARLAEAFVNDAFASCHRTHASVVGVARELPAYAGPALCAEVAAVSRLLHKSKRPFVAIIGGGKVSTKLSVVQALLRICDRVMLGGAMATTVSRAQGLETGRSFVEETMLAKLKPLLKSSGLLLPVDVAVVPDAGQETSPRFALIDEVGPKDVIVDIGPRTMKAWAMEMKTAKTILWNGPVGISEIQTYGSGSRFIARAVARHSRGSAFGIIGGGDTIPLACVTNTLDRFDFVSTGGGALLEFIIKKGKLPGLIPLVKQ